MKTRGLFARTLIFALVAVVAFATVATAGTSPKSEQIPKSLSCTSYGVTSGAYTMLAFFGEAWLDKYKMKVRVIPAGTDMARLIPLRSREVQFAASGVAAYFAQEGIYEYASKAWGPQDLRYMWIAQHPGCPMAVRGDSDIRKLSDLKGKRVPFVPGAAAVNVAVESFLKAGGLTWKDVVRVEVPSYGAAAKGVLNGTVDTCYYNVTGSAMYELAASPYGIRYLAPPESDTKAWEAMDSILPFYAPFVSTIGAGLSPQHPADTITYPYPIFTAYTDMPVNVAYWITRATNESYDAVSKKDTSGKMALCWPLKASMRLFRSNKCWPFHEGSIKYLKEIGVWTPQDDKINAAAIARQGKLQAAWKQTLAEAKAKKISDKDFADFWLKKRAAALGQ